MRKCEEREGIECEKQRKNELSILNREIWKGLTEKTALESDLEEPGNIWRESILGRDNNKGKVDVGVWNACSKNSTGYLDISEWNGGWIEQFQIMQGLLGQF